MEEQQSVAESMDGSPLEFHELAAELLATAYEDEGGQPPSALSEEGFLDAEAAALGITSYLKLDIFELFKRGSEPRTCPQCTDPSASRAPCTPPH